MSERDPKRGQGEPAEEPAARDAGEGAGARDVGAGARDDDAEARFVRSLLQGRKRSEGEDAELDAPDAIDEAHALDALDEDARAALNEPAPVLDEVDVRELLRSALTPPPGSVAPELLRGVQRRIRVRSRGKFFSDGWSTARSPRSTYLVTSLLMLALVVFVFFVLIPWGGATLP